MFTFRLSRLLFIVPVLFSVQDAKGGHNLFSFERLENSDGASSDASVIVVPTGGAPVQETHADFGDLLAISLADITYSNPNFDESAVLQSASEAMVNIPTGSTGFGPTTDTTSSVSFIAQRDTTGFFAGGSADTAADAIFLVTSDDTIPGFFEGGLYLVASGSNTSGVFGPLNLSSSINIAGAMFSIEADYIVSGVESLWNITVSTPDNLLQFTSPSLNQFVRISTPISPGVLVSFESTSFVNIGVFPETFGNPTEQGLWQSSASAFGWGAELPGDTDDDGDVDGDDLSAFEGGFGMSGGAALSDGEMTGGVTLSDGDMNGDGDVDGADFLVWQRYFGVTSNPPSLVSGSTAVPEPSSFFLSILAAILCVRPRLLQRRACSV